MLEFSLSHGVLLFDSSQREIVWKILQLQQEKKRIEDKLKKKLWDKYDEKKTITFGYLSWGQVVLHSLAERNNRELQEKLYQQSEGYDKSKLFGKNADESRKNSDETEFYKLWWIEETLKQYMKTLLDLQKLWEKGGGEIGASVKQAS